jgi:hypothetical protein
VSWWKGRENRPITAFMFDDLMIYDPERGIITGGRCVRIWCGVLVFSWKGPGRGGEMDDLRPSRFTIS